MQLALILCIFGLGVKGKNKLSAQKLHVLGTKIALALCQSGTRPSIKLNSAAPMPPPSLHLPARLSRLAAEQFRSP